MRRSLNVTCPPRGIGILTNDDTKPIGWKRKTLFPRANQTTSKRGRCQLVDGTFSAPCISLSSHSSDDAHDRAPRMEQLTRGVQQGLGFAQRPMSSPYDYDREILPKPRVAPRLPHGRHPVQFRSPQLKQRQLRISRCHQGTVT